MITKNMRRARVDNVDLLDGRVAKQVLHSAVRQAAGLAWVLAGRRSAWRNANRARWRAIDRAESRMWAAESRFWAKICQTATDGCGRLRWHKGFGWPREAERLDSAVESIRREAGFIEAATKLPRLCRLLSGGSWSRTGLTWGADVDPATLLRICPSPQRWERWLAKVRIRAARILRPWDTVPSYRQLAALLTSWPQPRRLPPVGKAAVALAGATLVARFGQPAEVPEVSSSFQGVTSTWSLPLPPPTPWWRVLAAMRVFRAGGNPARTVQPVPCAPAELEAVGARSADDRQSIWSPLVIARGSKGLLLADRDLSARSTASWVRRGQRAREAVVQVVVRNPANGERCHLTVPPWFGLPLWEGESADARIHAALAWGFGLTPSEYAPVVET